ncbi:FAD-dependent monooxygenase [Psychroflexus sp. MES1-P1E]|uniref:FAD-dependent monooxygenase n=1 Tax=Psychroflexus sp. MES1-P1E TaxID=2058320 RepID=UPI000C7B5006|nr:FAD-dependent monooxygenase [Psychroflexus sp. MES1-P1E]PKG41476.1 monooxygenase [Psychroflexus sp. MES1-P1E]
MKTTVTYDVVIIGGGPAGLSAAISLLQKQELSVLVIEGQAIGDELIGENCPPNTILLLKQLRVAKAFYKGNHAPCPGYASVWGRADVGYNDFIVNPLGPSWRLDRKAFDSMLADEARRLSAQIHWSTQFLDAIKVEKGYALRLRDRIANAEYKVNARFVVDASGANSRFAKAIGISKIIEDRLFASIRIASIAKGKPSKQIQIEAVPEGWWYNAALPDNRIITMMLSEKENIAALQDSQHEGFEAQLANTTFIAERLKKLKLKEHQYYTRPVYSGILPVIEGKDWVAIGDAASSYDPIAAYGIYKGISDGIRVTSKILAFFNGEEELNSFSAFVNERYVNYKKNRDYVYAIEQRWYDAPFWNKRIMNTLKITYANNGYK